MSAQKNFTLKSLAKNPEYATSVASWVYDEFWTDVPEVTEDSLRERFLLAREGEIPLTLMAFESDEILGTVSLIESDDEEREHLTPWIAALYVREDLRGKGIGKYLMGEVLQLAKNLGEKRVYLGTDKPDFYFKLGAQFHESVSADFKILFFDL